jgi:hypothetical protein
MENLKNNDIIYCKRTMIIEHNYIKRMNFRKNRKYVVKVFDYVVHVIGDYDIEIFNYSGSRLKNERTFEDYFYTLKQLRKVKLEKLDKR